MNRSCEILRRALAGADWDPGRLDEEERRHLERCPECAREAAERRRLAELLAMAVPAEDPELVARVLREVAPGFLPRLVSLAPAAAGGALVAVGAALTGGIPGAGVAGLVPRVTLGAGTTVAGGVLGVLHAMGSAAAAVHGVVPTAVPVAAGAVSLVGAGLLATGVRWLGRRGA